MKQCLILVGFIVIHTNLSASIGNQDSLYLAKQDSTSSTVSTCKLSTVSAVTVSAFVVAHGALNTLWWKGEYVPFYVNSKQDYEYALNADKFGHGTFSFIASRTYNQIFQWCGVSEEVSAWSGFGVATAYQTYIEIRDGYSKDYGFSWGDITANTVGAALPVLQYYVPETKPLTLQLSFYPSAAFRQGAYNAIIDDYTSTTHWLSIGVYDYLPTSIQAWYPEWLSIAIGHSVENLDGKGAGNHVVYLSLDWNLSKIKGLPPWLRKTLELLHVYHLPAPAVRIAPNVAWFGLKF